jgi:hypothetical protein
MAVSKTPFLQQNHSTHTVIWRRAICFAVFLAFQKVEPTDQPILLQVDSYEHLAYINI